MIEQDRAAAARIRAEIIAEPAPEVASAARVPQPQFWVEDACAILDAHAQRLGWDSHVYSAQLRILAALEPITTADALAVPEIAAMADRLISEGLHDARLSVDGRGWPNGLKIRFSEDSEFEMVAELSLEDSQIGPRLWDFAITILRHRAAFTKEPKT